MEAARSYPPQKKKKEEGKQRNLVTSLATAPRRVRIVQKINCSQERAPTHTHRSISRLVFHANGVANGRSLEGTETHTAAAADRTADRMSLLIANQRGTATKHADAFYGEYVCVFFPSFVSKFIYKSISSSSRFGDPCAGGQTIAIGMPASHINSHLSGPCRFSAPQRRHGHVARCNSMRHDASQLKWPFFG